MSKESDLLNFDEVRHERKFIIQDLTLQDLENIIKLHPLMFKEIFKQRQINNIYLDSLDLQNYYDNIEGHSQRLKARLRWYGETFGLIKNPILELKIKSNELGKKLRFPLKPFILDDNLSLEFLQKTIFPNSALPALIKEKLKLYQLVLLNSYKRRYFISSNKKYRLTLDIDLAFFEIKNKINSFKHTLVDKETFILELKYDTNNEDKISALTQQFPFRLSKSSKYISGLNILNDNLLEE